MNLTTALPDYRITATHYVALTVTIFITPFIINHLILGRYSLALAAFGLASLAAILAYLTKCGSRWSMVMVRCFVPCLILYLALAIAGQGVAGAVWCSPVAVVIYLMLPEKQAWFANAVSLMITTILGFTYLEFSLAIRLVMSLVFVNMFTTILIRVITKQQQRLHLQAVTDSLTGLSDRVLLATTLEHAGDYARANECDMTLVALDIDHFKHINDNYGHDMGDQVLVALAKMLKDNMRRSDTVFRLGGEEFLVVLYESDLEQSIHVAEKLRQAVKDLPLNQQVSITSSFGVASFNDGENWRAWIKRADEKLYQAKAAGRDCVVA
ncbi:GGDEF domain-containing protein [Teredinibacter waterburyi]|uniref:GGDEF domain-containing protein n=1 Tax=Teredinibacter waterburyi TaxID=1500538 RepID=UPI00165F1217|nr:GGDEF domain-containing protein [Teredinibacter waterburyi]